MTTTFTTFVAPAVLAATLLAGGVAEAQTRADFLANGEGPYYSEVADFLSDFNLDYNATGTEMVRFETPLGTKYCPQGEVYVTQERTFGKTIDYRCMPKAQYQQMLANYHNRPQNTYVPGNTGGGNKVCTGRVGMYGQVFASCF